MKKKGNAPPFCDWNPSGSTTTTDMKSVIYRFRDDFQWVGVKTEQYKKDDGGWAAVIRRTLVGGKGEKARFHLRYFEIEPGGRTSLERHQHEHVVICIRGQGIVRIGEERHTVKPFDTAFIAGDNPHQLQNPFNEPFGFFCIVNARRDRPKPA